MVAGFEIHHAVTGAILLGLVLVGWITRAWPRNRIAACIAGIGSGAVLDQSIYMSLVAVTDAAYDSSLSWAGMVIGAVVMGVGVFWRRSDVQR